MSAGKEVLISDQMLMKAICWETKFRNKGDEELPEALSQISHLKLHGQGITRVDDLSQFVELEVLYLYDNRIRSLCPLVCCTKLTHLYLQSNALRSTDMIHSLPFLKKLYLDCNQISRVSGLHGCDTLEELHVSDQFLDGGDAMTFEEDSIASLGGSLKILVAQNNQMEDVGPLRHLVELEEVNLSSNNLADNSNLGAMLKCTPKLRKISLLSNPVCKLSRGIEAEAILACSQLVEFNNKPVSDQKRKFIQQMERSKQAKKKTPQK